MPKTFRFSTKQKFVSASKLSTVMMCPQKYEFKYILGMDEEKKFYLTRGAIFHEVLAEFLADPTKNKKYFIDLVYDKFVEAKKAGKPTEDFKSPEAKVIASVLSAVEVNYDKISTMSKFKILKYDDGITPAVPAIELEFRIPFVDIETMQPYETEYDLLGYIDEISYDDENGLSLRDHKLHSKKYTDFDMATDLQLGLYAYTFKYLYKMGCFPELKIKKLDKVKVGFNSNLIKKTTNSTEFSFVNQTLSWN
jgi:ATP-dependent helicase/DNAse subunit B